MTIKPQLQDNGNINKHAYTVWYFCLSFYFYKIMQREHQTTTPI